MAIARGLPHRYLSKLLFYSAITLILAIVIGVLIFNPLWEHYAPFPRDLDHLPDITAPVDGLFYLQNATEGYRWDTRYPPSLLFHPLLSIFLRFLPGFLPDKIWFWLISIAFAGGSLVLVHRLACVLTETSGIPAKILPLCLIAPGGLIMATGNAEIPCLFFTLILLLSVLHWQLPLLTICSAALAILTKPNALYMVPILICYAAWDYWKGRSAVFKPALAGVVAILSVWLAWMLIVDWQTGVPGAYWNARMSFNAGVAGGFSGFFERLVRSYLYDSDPRDRIRYSSAIIVPIGSLVIYGLAPFSDERHRYAMAFGVLSMMAIALWQGNPNKILVYSTTLPGHFVAHIVFVSSLTNPDSTQDKITRIIMGVLYTGYCLVMALVFIFGTPLLWYY